MNHSSGSRRTANLPDSLHKQLNMYAPSAKTRLCKLARSFAVGSPMVLAIWLTMAIAAPAQTFKTLASFDATNGGDPYFAPLVQGRDGNYYGTTTAGGANGMATVFKVTPNGTLTILYSFCSQTN
jgi:uncharacterized repeat protein (TIGR03803 family)